MRAARSLGRKLCIVAISCLMAGSLVLYGGAPLHANSGGTQSQGTANAAVPAARIVQAHEWSAKSGGVSVENGVAPDDTSVANIASGDWLKYEDIDFGDGSYDTFMATLSSDESGKSMEIRLDSQTGTLIGTLQIQQTTNRSIFKEQYAAISSVVGVHDVYLVFPDAVAASVNWFVLGQDSTSETEQEKRARMQWFKDARFGNFPVWGPYSVLGSEYNGIRGGEWIMNIAKIPKAEYIEAAARPLSEGLNASTFDAADWVSLAKQAGQKYMVVTSKFHDGFSMFETNVTDFKGYDIVSLGQSGRDPIQELAEESRQQGIKFGVYYSILDWANPNADGFVHDTDPTLTPNRALYITQMKEQLRELIENYDVDLIWFDGGWYSWLSPEIGADIYRYLRTLKHDIIVNNRLGHGNGDYGTPEQNIPTVGSSNPWETCMTINGVWGYAPYDTNWKTPQELMVNLTNIASKGGNFLLSVGPKGDGTIPQESIDRLLAMGDWLEEYGDSIYSTDKNMLLEDTEAGTSTTGTDKVYVHLANWPANQQLAIPQLSNTINDIYLMNDPGTTLSYRNENGRTIITLPAVAPDPYVSVVVIDVVGEPMLYPYENLAQNKPTNASSTWYNSPEYSAAKAVDGNPETRWASGPNTTSAWLEVDFGSQVVFNKVKISEFSQRVTAYTIQYWNGSAWLDVHTGTTIGSSKVAEFDPVVGSKARLNLLSATDVPSIYEFGLYNTLTDHARSKPAAASATWYDNPTYGADKAVDGDPATRWGGVNNSAAAWLEVDLGEAVTFNHVEIREFYTSAPRISGFTVQYWDGNGWEDAYTGTTIGTVKLAKFDSVTGSKVRLNMTISGSDAPTLYSFSVYNA
ncbi:alpha-L-fucosidase [Cohnella sp. SGD-V74]|nr:alpha-L-fucosidase [Cohnella sp. SGD-V74]